MPRSVCEYERKEGSPVLCKRPLFLRPAPICSSVCPSELLLPHCIVCWLVFPLKEHLLLLLFLYIPRIKAVLLIATPLLCAQSPDSAIPTGVNTSKGASQEGAKMEQPQNLCRLHVSNCKFNQNKKRTLLSTYYYLIIRFRIHRDVCQLIQRPRCPPANRQALFQVSRVPVHINYPIIIIN